MRNVMVIFKKQIKDTFKNKTILIQFLMFPMMTIFMGNAIHITDMPEHFFAKLFSIMYIGMAPLTSVAAIISEEKEKNTLRPLMMANVKPAEYLVGIGSYVWLICMLGASVIAVSAGFTGTEFAFYMAVMAVGFIVSILAGSAVGVYAENQMKSTSLVMPVMMILSFLPMFAMFNETIEKIARFTYTQQLSRILGDFNLDSVSNTDFVIIGINVAVFALLFNLVYHKKGLEN
ncbi:MAG: ABC transporter permease [Saccharofermentans sp.]|nr:ABC transporter permease [Saccharofermentans sp.]